MSGVVFATTTRRTGRRRDKTSSTADRRVSRQPLPVRVLMELPPSSSDDHSTVCSTISFINFAVTIAGEVACLFFVGACYSLASVYASRHILSRSPSPEICCGRKGVSIKIPWAYSGYPMCGCRPVSSLTVRVVSERAPTINRRPRQIQN